jgi:hypothetical protein
MKMTYCYFKFDLQKFDSCQDMYFVRFFLVEGSDPDQAPYRVCVHDYDDQKIFEIGADNATLDMAGFILEQALASLKPL